MSTRRLGISSAALVLAALGVASTGCADQTVAARVGDDTVTEQELIDEVEALAPAVAAETGGELEGSYSQEFVGAVIQNRVVLRLLERVLDEEGVEVTDADRAQVRQQLEQGGGFSELPDWYQDQVVEDEALWLAFGQLPPDEAEPAFFDMADRLDIEVSRRYGSWDPDRLPAAMAQQGTAVVPPEGPQAPPGGGDGDGEGSGGGQGPGGGQGGQGGQDGGGPAGSSVR